ncbi:MAG: ATP-binding protein [Frankiales bacterium]|nr:ATP-binding protein [Frankiales bacterium]
MTAAGDASGVSLVGWAPELHVVTAAVQRLTDREGGALALVGPAGVGKSRVARESGPQATEAGATVLTGRAVTTGTATACGPPPKRPPRPALRRNRHRPRFARPGPRRPRAHRHHLGAANRTALATLAASVS